MVIPSYARPELIREAVKSVLQQTHRHLNVFVVEDGTSLFASSARKLSQGDERVSYISLFSNKGVSFARNIGASLGRGEFIAFLDSDDLWLKDKLKHQLELLNGNPNMNWVHCDEIWNKNGRPVKQQKYHRKQGGIFTERSFERCLISPSSVLFRRSFWEAQKTNFLNHFRVAEDYELWLRLGFQNPIGFVDKALVVKRAGNWDQLSRTIEIDRYRVLALRRFHREYSRQEGFADIEPAWRQEILKKIRRLKKGALKYGHTKKYSQYQNWEMLFSIERTDAQS